MTEEAALRAEGAMTIDMHAHWLPKPLADGLRRRTEPPMIGRGDDGRDWLDVGFQRTALEEGFDDAAVRLRDMDRNGVTRGVLSLSTFYGIECLPLEDALPLCRAFNDAVSAAAVAHPDRFSGLAALPVADAAATLAEFDRAMALPGMVGALLPGDGFLSAQRARRFEAVFAAANQRGAILLVHYGHLAGDAEAPRVDRSDNPRMRIGTLDMQARLSANMITFAMTDFLEAFPDVTVMSHNLGGNIPFEVERLDHRASVDRPGEALPSERIRASRVLVDCNSLGARAIELAVEVYGADRIVFGSDGTDFGMAWSQRAIKEARIGAAEKHAILEANAARALSLVGRRLSAAAAE